VSETDQLNLLESTFDRKRISANSSSNLNSNLSIIKFWDWRNDIIFRESIDTECPSVARETTGMVHLIHKCYGKLKSNLVVLRVYIENSLSRILYAEQFNIFRYSQQWQIFSTRPKNELVGWSYTHYPDSIEGMEVAQSVYDQGLTNTRDGKRDKMTW